MQIAVELGGNVDLRGVRLQEFLPLLEVGHFEVVFVAAPHARHQRHFFDACHQRVHVAGVDSPGIDADEGVVVVALVEPD